MEEDQNSCKGDTDSKIRNSEMAEDSTDMDTTPCTSFQHSDAVVEAENLEYEEDCHQKFENSTEFKRKYQKKVGEAIVMEECSDNITNLSSTAIKSDICASQAREKISTGINRLLEMVESFESGLITHSEPENSTKALTVYNDVGSKFRNLSKYSNKGSDLKTLEDALTYFDLHSRFQELEKSLEDVRRNRKSKEEHESDFKKFDKDLLKLCQKHHPDRAKNRGCSDKGMEDAQKSQTALNATRKILNILNKSFMEDIDIDHKYGFYTKLDITLLGNEDEIENYVFQILFKLSLIAEIKQRNIIPEIRKFLRESNCCVKSYSEGNLTDFEKYRSSSLFHLKRCITGYKKLLAEFETVEKECRDEKLDNVHPLVRKMAGDCSKQLRQLKQLMETHKYSLEGKLKVMENPEEFDDYFVLPFVCYINVIIMCNIMTKSTRERNWSLETIWEFIYAFLKRLSPVPQDSINSNQATFLARIYDLMAFCNDDEYNSKVEGCSEPNASKPEIKRKFHASLKEIIATLETKFKMDDYNENNIRIHITEDLRKCVEMMNEFEELKKELSQDIETTKKNYEEMYEGLNERMKHCERLNKKFEETSEKNSELKERIAAYIADKGTN